MHCFSLVFVSSTAIDSVVQCIYIVAGEAQTDIDQTNQLEANQTNEIKVKQTILL